MLTSFWEDYYEDHKLEARKDEDGEVRFETGDPYIDKWEKEIAMGLTPDLLEDLPSWHREKEQKYLNQLAEAKRREVEGDDLDDDGFNDTYSPSLPSSVPVLGQARKIDAFSK